MNAPAPVTIVSGLPRSGTSMMMRMLEAGGLPPLTDAIRAADTDNPRGYYEFERVKRLKEDRGWLDLANGRALKVISFLLPELPLDRPYEVVFMCRDLAEVLASQRAMLLRRGEPAGGPEDDARMRSIYEKHLAQVTRWLDAQPCCRWLELRYAAVLAEPAESAARVAEFLSAPLDPDRMAAVAEPGLRHQRVSG